MTVLPETDLAETDLAQTARHERADPATTPPTLSQRAVDKVAGLLAGRSLTRRRFLSRAAVVGSALAVNPLDYVLKPVPAYGVVTDCGSASNCGDGWTAFCATIQRGANTCPPGSYVAGWWKVDSTSFCPDENGRPGTRFYIDCNRLPSASCSARCSGDACDSRAVCRNNFRYGQCNQQIRGITQVVCRVVTCAPPWEYDATCTTTVRTDSRTESHNSPYLAPRRASRIRLRWQDMGQTGSVLGRQTMEERGGAGGRVAGYDKGYLLYSAATGVHAVLGAIANRYAAIGLDESVLGYPVGEDQAVGDGRGRLSSFAHGAIYWTPDTGAREVTRGIHVRYRVEGGPTGFLGYPVSGETPAPAGRLRSDFSGARSTGGWSIVWDPSTDETRIIPSDVDMPEDGSWPPQVEVARWSGTTREDTAAAVSEAIFSPGVDVAYVARADEFADALTGGVAAALGGGPLLLTVTDRLPEETTRELARLRPASIVVLGGRGAVSARVERELATHTDGEVVRISGDDRYATAAAVSRRQFPDGADTCYLATGRSFADALAGGPRAARAEVPLLLTAPDELPDATKAEIVRLGVRSVIALGGDKAVADAVVERLRTYVEDSVTRISGRDRYGTAAEIAEATSVADDVFVVTGADFPDGLAACPAAAQRSAPVLLTSATTVPAATDAQLRRLAPSRVVIVGGDGVVSEQTAKRLSYYVPTG
jgi:putative cell wall-binding protein